MGPDRSRHHGGRKSDLRRRIASGSIRVNRIISTYLDVYILLPQPNLFSRFVTLRLNNKDHRFHLHN